MMNYLLYLHALGQSVLHHCVEVLALGLFMSHADAGWISDVVSFCIYLVFHTQGSVLLRHAS